MARRYLNVHGRKGGRGLRPWLLIPKLIAVAGYFGGLAALAVLAAVLCEADPATAGGLVKGMLAVFWFVLAPAALVASLLGLGLLALHGRVLLAMRWLQVKLGLLVAALPVIHFVVLERLERVARLAGPLVRDSLAYGPFDAAGMRSAASDLLFATLAVMGLLAGVIWLGRHKPRLGQNPAAAYRKARAAQGETQRPPASR